MSNNIDIFEKIKSFSFDTNKERIFGLKSGIIWGHSKDTNNIFPILYLSKPKHITQEDFYLILEKIEINFKL